MRPVLERDPRHVPMQVQCPNSPSRGNVRIRLFNGLKRPVEHSKVGRQFNSGIDYRFEVCQDLAIVCAALFCAYHRALNLHKGRELT